MAYTTFDATKPAGTQTGTAFADSANANDKGLRDAILMGQMQGFAFSVSGGTASEPLYMLWKNSSTWLRATLTWGTTGGENGQITQAVWALSINSGSDYTTAPGGAICTETMTYDSAGNLTATTNASGIVSWLCALLGKVKQHTAMTGSSAHGLGTISTQSAASVAITGGTASGLAISSSTASLTYEREAKVAKGNVSSSTAIDWAAGGLQTLTVTGSGGTLTHSNLPSGVCGFVTLDVTNGGVASSLLTGCKFVGGAAPSLTASGRDVISLMCHDGSTVSVVGVIKDVR